MMRNVALPAVAGVMLMVAGCSSSAPSKPVESLGGTHDVSAFALRSVAGTRDGEKLEVQALYGDGAESMMVRLSFNVTPPARLTSGTWTGGAGSGVVRQRSVTFLGGQSAAPSIGGRFDLIGTDGRAVYRVTIPLQELRNRL